MQLRAWSTMASSCRRSPFLAAALVAAMVLLSPAAGHEHGDEKIPDGETITQDPIVGGNKRDITQSASASANAGRIRYYGSTSLFNYSFSVCYFRWVWSSA